MCYIFAGAVDQPADRQVSGDQEAVSLSLEERLLAAESKIVDFGNGCWTDKHFTDDIQTRQYRCPEVPTETVLHVCLLATPSSYAPCVLCTTSVVSEIPLEGTSEPHNMFKLGLLA